MATILHAKDLREKYLVERNLPTIWCSGCGIGTVLSAAMRAVDRLGLTKEEVVFSIGIGCSGYSSRYVNFDAAHTLHGRALPVATGMKLANPKLKVIVLTGDGDSMAIGGNHFIHAARRNINLTTIIFNNGIYGMTGGQYSPATPFGALSTTSPYGMIEGDFDAAKLAIAAGATYVARSSTYHVQHLVDMIAGGITHPGFAVVDTLCQCPNHFGRLNKQGTAAAMMRGYRDRCVRAGSTGGTAGEAAGATGESAGATTSEGVPVRVDLEKYEGTGRIPIGLLYKTIRPELTAEYAKMREAARAKRA